MIVIAVSTIAVTSYENGLVIILGLGRSPNIPVSCTLRANCRIELPTSPESTFPSFYNE